MTPPDDHTPPSPLCAADPSAPVEKAPSPAALLRLYGLRAKKSFGQCFLHDPGVVRRIADCAALGPGDHVLEIGAGLGVLTAELARRCGHVIAVERDRDLAALLRRRFDGTLSVEIREANALTLDLGPEPQPLSIVGNLPYNIAAPLLFHLLAQARSFRAATLMLQKEVADRLAAPPGSRTCGAPSVLVQRLARVVLCFPVPRGAFFPSPRVDSAVIRLLIHETPRGGPVDEALFHRVVHAAFSQRRKTLRGALSAAFQRTAVDRALAHASLDPGRRGETLTVEEYCALSRSMAGELAASGAEAPPASDPRTPGPDPRP